MYRYFQNRWGGGTALLLCATLFSSVSAQVIIIGNVQESAGKPLPAVSIQALHCTTHDTTIVAYALTDAQGRFRLKIEKKAAYVVKAKMLGYQSAMLFIAPTDSLVKHTFVLHVSPIALQEVTIKRLLPVKANDDTTRYKVQVFTDGTERNVEDLLRKLPGIQVGANGKITAFGKTVSKVMIEGEDIFSKNYQIITRSLSAQTLDQVQVIENYTENPLLKDIEKSNKVAINLGVKPNLKIRPFGNASAEIGYKNRYFLNGVGLSLVGKLKAGMVGNLNNTGYNSVEANEYELTDEPELKSWGANKSNLLASLLLTMVAIPDIEPKRVTFN